MQFIKQFFTMIACYCMVIQSTFANVGPVKIKGMNSEASMSNMQDTLNSYFSTAEDKRHIETDFIKLKAVAKNWNWRFEPQGDSVAFRLNGKVQYVFKVDESKPSSIFVNGQEVAIPNGKTYLAFKKEFESALNKTALNLDSLFFEEAHAGLFAALLGIGAVFGLGYITGRRQCHNSRNCDHRTCRRTSSDPGPHGPDVYPNQPPEVVDTPRVQTRRTCTQRGRRYNRSTPFTSNQMWISAQNFRFNCRYIHTRRDGRQVERVRARCFDNVQDCVNWKKRNPSRAFGHNLSENRARVICESLYNQVCECREDCSYSTPAPDQPVPPSTTTIPEFEYDEKVRSRIPRETDQPSRALEIDGPAFTDP